MWGHPECSASTVMHTGSGRGGEARRGMKEPGTLSSNKKSFFIFLSLVRNQCI